MEKNVTKHYVWGQAITSFNWCLKFSGLQGNELELNIQKLRNAQQPKIPNTIDFCNLP